MKEFIKKTKETFKKIWKFLKADTWTSFIVDLILAFLIIKYVFFPVMALLTGSMMPLVIVESCSMYHTTNLEDVIQNPIYSQFNLTYENTKSWGFRNGLSKGDIILVTSPKNLKVGDVIIFKASSVNPIIHRVISLNPLQTKGDHNIAQLTKNNNIAGVDETNIKEEQLVGKASFRVPFLGWAKLIFFEFSRSPNEKGFCK
jgi:signal peptidase I